MKEKSQPLSTLEHKRDAYGFAVRSQHIQRYREYAKIYKVEEEERSEKWKDFLERCCGAGSPELPSNDSVEKDTDIESPEESSSSQKEDSAEGGNSECDASEEISSDNAVDSTQKETVESHGKEKSEDKVELWAEIRPSLSVIEHMMSFRVKKKKTSASREPNVGRSRSKRNLSSIEEGSSPREEDSDEEFYDMERSDTTQEGATDEGVSDDLAVSTTQEQFPWKEELECLVQGGVPKALRGELWQAFVGVKTRRVDGYYHSLLNTKDDAGGNELNGSLSNGTGSVPKKAEKWKVQIEKDLPRTFPGHPALDEDGRNALRRLLTAYARHNPSVGYCQAMNFFAGLLLLLMPEENAFWTLMGLIDDYFDGYYSEEMIESQVDQLVFEELVNEKFSKLVNHLDYLGVQVAWVTGAWFLSIFMNMLPWESVIRIWDVLLFDGNRVMIFRTALALLELYGPALVTTKDAGDAITLLQSLAGSTFDSSQLVLTACMGYQGVNEIRLQELRNKHRPDVLAAMEERAQGLASKDSKGLASKLYSFKHDPGSLLQETNSKEGEGKTHPNGDMQAEFERYFNGHVAETELDSVPDLQEQITWLKVELCKLLEEKRSTILRAEELETALMEMVKQDNRRTLTAKVEQLEQEAAELRKALSEKQEQESAMLEVLMRVEQEQKVAEDARISAEQDAAAQRYAANVLQEKYEEAMILYGQMEKRAVMAETMLEATIQYNSSQLKVSAPSSPRTPRQESSQDAPVRRISLLSPFVGWRDRSKGKPSNSEDSSVGKNSNSREGSGKTPREVLKEQQAKAVNDQQEKDANDQQAKDVNDEQAEGE
ncbi:uncharacterized protein A4U43_C07F3390 [Asparagus officinalis]|uniref:Rab-GAP TBC domain-containing protein n=1 Tax=Asparagus officinalis TaxID=4686 RepID=A0A5P1ECD5_ASPOF|nr:uncharacterized protein A4U43_C07F3390 [Asparagus officinalis]